MTSFVLERGTSILKRCTLLLSKPTFVRKLAVIAALALAPCAADAKTIYVNAANPEGGNGSTWGRACKYLQEALNKAIEGDRIFIAAGTYYPDDFDADANGEYPGFGDREISFEINGVSLYGGFAGNEATLDQRDPMANPTILSGEIWDATDTPNPEIYWALHVVILKGSATLDGLTIEKGRANGREAPFNQGGGVYVESGTLTLVNCSINDCLAEQDGGAVFGDVIATGCTFSGNRADNERKATDAMLADPSVYNQNPDPKHSWLYNFECKGGAIAGNLTATDCRFLDNHVRARCVSAGITSVASGGAVAGTVSAKNCVFDGNTANATSYYVGQSDAFATARGGAIAGGSTLVNCVFTNNQANTIAQAYLMPIPPGPPYTAHPHSFGGAIAGRIGATNCVFADNSIFSDFRGGNINNAQSWGGALYVEDASDILNCVFVRNDASGDGSGGGGAIRASKSTVLPIMNCTLFDNLTNLRATCLSVGGDVKILSNIFWSSAPAGTPEILIHVDEYGFNQDAFASISNRLYPTPSTETINIVRGTIDINQRNTGVSSINADHDLGDQTRTLPTTDPLFVFLAHPEGPDGIPDTADDITTPEGPDGLWKTEDDGLRLHAPIPDTMRRAIGQGHPLFLPTDKFDLDEDGNITETIPVDIANFARIQVNPEPTPPSPDRQPFYKSGMDLGAYEFGEVRLAPEIQVESPTGLVLVDGVSSVTIMATPGVPVTKNFSIRNLGALPLRGLSITRTGLNSADFIVSQPANYTLGVGRSTTFSVTFTPTAADDLTLNIHIVSNDLDENPFDIKLIGRALVPEIAVEQPVNNDLKDGVSSLDYGTVDLINSASKTFVVRNSGEGELLLSSVTVTGTNATDFTVSAYPNKVAPGGSGTFKVTFKPKATGARVGRLSIKNNDPDAESNFTVDLKGNGVAAPEIGVYQPASLSLKDDGKKSFGEVKQGLSYTKTFTIRNVGSAKLKNIKVSLSGSSDFSLVKPKVTSLASGAKTTFTVTFKPGSAGVKTTRLRIKSNDADENPFDVELSGTGLKKSSGAKTSKSQLTGSSAIPSGKVTTVLGDDGLKYKVLTVKKTADWAPAKRKVQVSSNLVDWFSGPKHTTVLIDDATTLKVRDNTPVRKGAKRHIRLK